MQNSNSNTDTAQKLMTKYMLISVSDERVLDSAWLTGSGVETEYGYFVMGKHIDTFDILSDAIKEGEKQIDEQQIEQFEIKTIYTKK